MVVGLCLIGMAVRRTELVVTVEHQPSIVTPPTHSAGELGESTIVTVIVALVWQIHNGSATSLYHTSSGHPLLLLYDHSAVGDQG